MRHQAMETTSQLQAANDQLIATNEQLDLMRKQAEETDKQSKTLMVFTVVTIVFVRPPPPQASLESCMSPKCIFADG